LAEEARLGNPLIFDGSHYDKLNPTRGEVLTKLLGAVGRDLGLQTAVDVGCGVGYFSGLLNSLGLRVIGVDGRKENIEEAKRRSPGVDFLHMDAQDAGMVNLGVFDLCLCFGLLYHLENPFLAIRHLHSLTKTLLLVEAVTFPGTEPIMALIDEEIYADQGLHYFAFYPTEACLIKMLYRAGFPHVYGFSLLPSHPEYTDSAKGRRTRTMLAASQSKIESPYLRSVAEPASHIRPWDPQSGADSHTLKALLKRVVTKVNSDN
jgi:SAM-dependent methyltransferase